MEVSDQDPQKRALKGQRLLRVAGVQVVTQMKAPSSSDPKGSSMFRTAANPAGAASLEWSNTFARSLWDKMGTVVHCDFTDAS